MTIALILGYLMLIPQANAVEFTSIQADKSSLSFIYRQMNVPIDGHFKKFSTQLSFDPAKPASAKAAFDLDLNSIDAGSDEANDEVVGKEWFNAKAFPKASFVSSTIRPLGETAMKSAAR
jgi:polyisoprenoid-binding protein YceI